MTQDIGQQAWNDIMMGAFDDELEEFVNEKYRAFDLLCKYAPIDVYDEVVERFVDHCLDSEEWMARYERDFAQKEE